MRKIRSSGKDWWRIGVELLGRLQVAAEGLLDDDPAPLGEADRVERLDHERERRGRDGEVEDGVLGVVAVERGGQRLEGGDVGVVAGHEVEAGAQRVDGRRHGVRLGGQDGVVGVLAEALVAPAAAGHADDGHLQSTVPLHVVERREQLLLRQVAGGAEQHQDICFRLHAGHRRRDVTARVAAASGQCTAERTATEPDALPSEASRSRPALRGERRRRSRTPGRGGRTRPGRRRA